MNHFRSFVISFINIVTVTIGSFFLCWILTTVVSFIMGKHYFNMKQKKNVSAQIIPHPTWIWSFNTTRDKFYVTLFVFCIFSFYTFFSFTLWQCVFRKHNMAFSANTNKNEPKKEQRRRFFVRFLKRFFFSDLVYQFHSFLFCRFINDSGSPFYLSKDIRLIHYTKPLMITDSLSWNDK